MNAVWLEREDGIHVLMMSGKAMTLAEIVPFGEERCDVWILDRMKWASCKDVKTARNVAIDLIRKTCEEIITDISEIH